MAGRSADKHEGRKNEGMNVRRKERRMDIRNYVGNEEQNTEREKC